MHFPRRDFLAGAAASMDFAQAEGRNMPDPARIWYADTPEGTQSISSRPLSPA